MFEKLAMSMAISFVLKQLDKFKGQIDWNQVQKDLDERVRALIPGTWFDDDAVKLVNSVLEAVKYALGDNSKIQAILKLLAAKDWTTAASSLRVLILNSWSSGAVAANQDAREIMTSIC